MRARRGMVAALLTVTLAASPAQAQASGGDPHDAAQRAEVHYQMAMRLFNQGRYREAVEEFDQALVLLDDPIFWCNRAVPLMKLDEMDAARESLASCRDGLPAGSEDRAQVDAQLAALTVAVRQVRARARELASWEKMPLPVVAPRVEEVEGMSGRSVAGWSVAGAGVALVGAAWIIDLRSAGVVETFQQASAQGGSRERYDALRSEVALRQRVVWSLAGVGAAAALVGTGLLTWDVLADDAEPGSGVRLAVEPVGGAGVVGVGVRLSR
ncbi:hypothetical protein DL240_18305 [Lujinxingia litoralis]|uniref:Uncharacterized protein n=1 Tax=Lujinxingia litoralis TaxID=2211119 RepID=A0A328C300_9DELT|nr:tetratricopeptide repeat protein [Lujinxingia litoralis]RAL20171.1 hypothetical protein DL240_18305 [Lujinxingia litoralis]